MGQRAIKLDLLEQLIAVPDPRQLAEVALQAFRDVVPGDHFSAILFNVKTRKVEDYFLNQGWLAANTPFWQAAQQRLVEHPLAQRFLAQRQSMTLVRSRVVHGQPVMMRHGALLPLFRLTTLLEGRSDDMPSPGLPIVVLGDGRRRLGIQVDRVVRRQELFVRDIHPRIAAIPGIGGAAVLGDGRVVLIVDGGDLFQLARAHEPPV